jgi:FixJ family two-component response regulator
VDETLSSRGAIAIIDDDQPLREALASVLKAASFQTNTFASAEEFIYSPSRRDTACLVLDVRLPRMSGVELQRYLYDAHSQIPIIFVSAHGDAALRNLVMNAGAAGFLSKPVRSDALLKEIQAALEKSRTDTHA